MPLFHDYYAALKQAVSLQELPLALAHLALLSKSLTQGQRQELESAPSAAEAKKLLDFWFGSYITEPVKNLAVLIAQGREWHALSGLSEHGRKRLDEEVRVTSAKPLPDQLKQLVEAAVGSDGAKITFAHNPSLIGGIKIQVGDREIDHSIQSRLAQVFM